MSEAAVEPTNYAALAKQAFGSNYHGEVPEEPAVEPTAEVPEETAEVSAEEAATSEDASAEETPAEEEEVVSSLSELIESQGWDPEWANGLKVSVKVDGETGEASLDDLVRSYQTQEAATRRLESAKEQAAEIRQQAQQQQEAVKAQMVVLGTLVQQVEGQIAAEFGSVDWAKLESDDPGEYARLRLKKTEREQQLGAMKQQALQQYQNTLAQQQQEQRAKHDELLKAETALLLEAVPEWSNPEVAKAEQEALVGHLTSRGFSPEDVMGASDHRLILLARDAMKYRESQATANAAAKKVAKVPKVLKPGAPKSEAQVNQAQEAALRKRIRAGGKTDDAIAAAAELMKSRRN